MKIKIGTQIEDGLVRRAKKISVARRVPLNQIFEDALQSYLETQVEKETLTLDEVLKAEPCSYANVGEGKGAGDIADEDFD